MRTFLLKTCLLLTPFLLTSRVTYAQENWIKKSPDSTKISTVETTPWGLLAGENDSRMWLEPFNGVYISDDLGDSWSQLGLNNRGITDITFGQDSIYASTYYFEGKKAGLFISRDGGQTWTHSGNNFSTSAVSTDNSVVYLGTFSHGLWVSFDTGATWEQKIGEGFFGPKIFTIESLENVAIAALQNSTFISHNSGETWQEVPALNGINIRSIEITNQTILLGAENSSGLFRSLDNGISWENVYNWGENSVGAIKHYKNIFYAGKLEEQTAKYDIYKSLDYGITWESTNLSHEFNNGQILDIAWLFSDPSYLFTVLPYEGIYRYEIELPNLESFPFLETPWNIQFENEYLDKITSFFDHKYPLTHLEPSNTRGSTMNYLGIEGSFPYSGHKGYDYSIDYNTPVLAAFHGYSTYFFDTNLGNSIRIDHANGYTTVYSHLQKNGLVNTTDTPVWVEAGDQLGLVGMTGNITGPHLHFEVIKEKSVDPYGWQPLDIDDPWEILSGEKSLYLWNHPLTKAASYIKQGGGEISLDNKRVIIDQNSSEYNFTIFVETYTKPIVPASQKRLTYITGTSFIINALNNLGWELPDMLKPTKIEIDFSNANLNNIKENSLKIYSLNKETQRWEELPSFLDLAAKIIISESVHFSHFAVLGEKIDYEPPNTSISIEGEIEEGWYNSPPTITLRTYNDTNKIYYSINNESWVEYSNPFEINNEGINSIEYRSMDSAGNIESTKDLLVKVDTLGVWNKTLSIYDNTFIIE